MNDIFAFCSISFDSVGSALNVGLCVVGFAGLTVMGVVIKHCAGIDEYSTLLTSRFNDFFPMQRLAAAEAGDVSGLATHVCRCSRVLTLHHAHGPIIARLAKPPL